MTVIDCISTKNMTLDSLARAGVTGIMRYLAPANLGKVIDSAEYRRLTDLGINIGLVYEHYALDWIRGSVLYDAVTAVEQAKALGYPAGSTIYTACDFDISPTDWEHYGDTYARHFKTIVEKGGYQAGVYGPWDVLQWCQEEIGYQFFWQCMSTAWSNKRNRRHYPDACLWQRNSGTVAGTSVDFNTQYRPFGGSLDGGSVALTDAEKHYITSACACLVVVGYDDRGYVDKNDIPWDSVIAEYNNRVVEERMTALVKWLTKP
jgi:hypothetical protein